MSRKHIQKIYQSEAQNNAVCAIIPAAGCGRRMKSYGPKALLEIHDKNIITEVQKIASIDDIKFERNEDLIELIDDSFDDIYLEKINSIINSTSKFNSYY